jgi:hypothetical protein
LFKIALLAVAGSEVLQVGRVEAEDRVTWGEEVGAADVEQLSEVGLQALVDFVCTCYRQVYNPSQGGVLDRGVVPVSHVNEAALVRLSEDGTFIRKTVRWNARRAGLYEFLSTKQRFLPRYMLEVTGEKATFRVWPVGRVGRPRPDQVPGAIECVIHAVRRLHAVGYAHGDARWPNVVEEPDGGDWMLIDVDNAVVLTDRSEECDYRRIARMMTYYMPVARDDAVFRELLIKLAWCKLSELRRLAG